MRKLVRSTDLVGRTTRFERSTAREGEQAEEAPTYGNTMPTTICFFPIAACDHSRQGMSRSCTWQAALTQAIESWCQH